MDNPTNTKNQLFRLLYRGKTRERFNKAIRKEIPGGSELLETMQFVYQISNGIKRRGGRIEILHNFSIR